jgi:RNA polymerase sigma-54 factor
MHESTVSRVINGKFMATPIGVFELKYFFSSSLTSQHGGEDVSSTTVKHLIQEIIHSEPSHKPYSDAALVKHLANKGIQLARRTVTKYREALNLGSSVERRRSKKLDF